MPAAPGILLPVVAVATFMPPCAMSNDQLAEHLLDSGRLNDSEFRIDIVDAESSVPASVGTFHSQAIFDGQTIEFRARGSIEPSLLSIRDHEPPPFACAVLIRGGMADFSTAAPGSNPFRGGNRGDLSDYSSPDDYSGTFRAVDGENDIGRDPEPTIAWLCRESWGGGNSQRSPARLQGKGSTVAAMRNGAESVIWDRKFMETSLASGLGLIQVSL